VMGELSLPLSALQGPSSPRYDASLTVLDTTTRGSITWVNGIRIRGSLPSLANWIATRCGRWWTTRSSAPTSLCCSLSGCYQTASWMERRLYSYQEAYDLKHSCYTR